MATYEELIAKARELDAAGNTEDAKRLAALAVKMRGQPGATPAAPASPKGWGQTIKENLLGDDDPNTQNWGEYIGSALNKGGEAMTFGLAGDESSAAVESALGIGDYDTRRQHYQQQEEVLERDNPGTALTAELGGSLLGAFAPGGGIGTLGRGAGLVPRIAASSAAGAGMAGLYGAMEGDEGDGRLAEGARSALMGGAVGAAIPAIGAGVQRVADDVVGRRAMRAGAAGAPSSEALRASGRAAYDQVDAAGVQIRPQSFDDAKAQIVEYLRGSTGYDELPGPSGLTPKSARVVQMMDEAGSQMAADPTAALPFKSLDQMRRRAGVAAGDMANKADSAAGSAIIGGLDDFVERLGPDDVVAGDVTALKDALPKARDIWRRMSKSQMLDDAIDAGENYLSGTGSGIRNQFKRILNNPKLARNFTEAEIAAMRRVANGTLPEKLVQIAGGGLGNLTAAVGGAAAGGIPGALAGVLGAGLLRGGSDALTKRNAELARALVANGRMNTLPVATDSARQIAEALLRRTAAAGPQ
jgi:hypothetical protein